MFLIPWIGIACYRFRFSLADGHTGTGQWRGVVLSKQVLQAATHPGIPESIEWFIEGQAFLPSYDLATTPPLPSASCLSFSVLLTGRAYWQEKGGLGRSQIIRRWESLVIYKSFNTLWGRCIWKLWTLNRLTLQRRRFLCNVKISRAYCLMTSFLVPGPNLSLPLSCS